MKYPIPDNWDELNRRRGLLIRRKYMGTGLTLGEEKELSGLQEIAGEVANAMTPPLHPDLIAAMERLGIN